MRSYLLLPTLLASGACCLLSAQDGLEQERFAGHWSGAFIRNGNSTQAFVVDIVPGDSAMVASVSIADWIGYEPTVGPVELADDVLRFNSPYGRIAVVLDAEFSELIGACGFAQVHLKRALRPVEPPTERVPITFRIGDTKLSGELVKPIGKGPFTTAVLVQGRGCGTRQGWQRRPEVFAQRGLAVVIYDKRGGVGEPAECDRISIQQHATDLARIVEEVQGLSSTGAVGLIAESAGAWAAYQVAASKPDRIAFMATVAGPATSVREQQLDCATYYVRDELGLDERCVEQARLYTELQYGDRPDSVYAGLMALLDSARVNGWIDVLDASDMPASAAAIDDLWVRRNVYDPTADLRSYTGPLLALLGEQDNIVPWRENSQRFKTLFATNGKPQQSVVVIPGVGHSMEHGHRLRDLGYSAEMNAWNTYFKFDRVDSAVTERIIAFLRANKLL